MVQTFQGKTEDAEAPFLTAGFWREGTVIRGEVIKLFVTHQDKGDSQCYTIQLDDPVEVDGEEVERVSIGSSGGFLMALGAARLNRLLLKDKIELECTGAKKARKEGYSDRVNFSLKVIRP